jgi:hypothetical protein
MPTSASGPSRSFRITYATIPTKTGSSAWMTAECDGVVYLIPDAKRTWFPRSPTATAERPP